MRTMTARYPGRCAATGAPINPGDTIEYDRHTRRAYLAAPSIDPDTALAAELDPELAATDPEAAASAGRYLRRSMQRSVSHTWNSGGREYYRNKAGRCEDAPCCGCCNA